MSTFVIDIDNTILTSVKIDDKYDYAKSKPYINVIDKINLLYNSSNEIILFTARGMNTFKNDVTELEKYHRPILENWLICHNVQYTKLIFGKIWMPDYYFIDDRNLTINQFLHDTNYEQTLICNRTDQNLM